MEDGIDYLKTIKNSDKKIMSELELFNDLSKDYRKSLYIVESEVTGGFLLLNTITQEMVFISEKEYTDDFFETEYAKKSWFSVPKDFNEFRFVQSYRRQKSNNNRYDKPFKFTIFTTLVCNANCFYCFEKSDRYNSSMSIKTSSQIVDFIDKYADKKQVIELAWFGGEPLLNTVAIDYICSELNKRSIKFFSTMISNGVLVDNEIIKKAIEVWNLKDIQITLDGTEQLYNRIKKLTYNGNAFLRVIENIKLLLEHSIVVYIRLNLNKTNYTDLCNLIDYLLIEFKNKDDNLKVYCDLLYERTCGVKNDFVINNELLERQITITQKLSDCGLYKVGIPRDIKVFNCNPDSGREIVLLPNGKIGWCEHYISTRHIGNITEYLKDEQMICSMQERYDPVDQCKNCSFFPYCIRLVVCDNCVDFCDEYRMCNKIKNLRIQMKNTYYTEQNN